LINLNKLTYLNLSINKINGNLNNLSNLKNLKNILLSDNYIIGSLSSFNNISTLTELDISKNYINCSLFDMVGHKYKLTYCNLRNNYIFLNNDIITNRYINLNTLIKSLFLKMI